MKSHFALPAGVYLLSQSTGCLPVDSLEVLTRRYYQPWRDRGGEAWGAWLEEIERFRRAVATVLGGRPEAICPQTNVSAALTKIVHGLSPVGRRRVLLLCEEDFPSLGFVLSMAQRLGFTPRFLPAGRDPQDPARWAEALDDSVRLALVTHAFSNRSARLPVAEITAICAARGIVSVVDVAQTAGAIPIDVSAWQADFVIGSCLKLLCGGPGAGFLWASERAIGESRPVDVGWFSHAEPFEFDIHHFEYAGDALRFWGGTPSIAPFVQAAHSIETLLGIGLERIHAHNQALITRLLEAVGPRCVASVKELEQRGNTVLLRVTDAATASKSLRKASVFTDSREGGIRLAPHIYNTEGDIDELLRVVRPFLAA